MFEPDNILSSTSSVVLAWLNNKLKLTNPDVILGVRKNYLMLCLTNVYDLFFKKLSPKYTSTIRTLMYYGMLKSLDVQHIYFYKLRGYYE